MSRSLKKPMPSSAASARKTKEKKFGNRANIAELKTHLGQYLKKVRDGHEVTVLDRNLVVAKLIPYSQIDENSLEEPIESTRAQESLSMALDKIEKNRIGKKMTPLKQASINYLSDDRANDRTNDRN